MDLPEFNDWTLRLQEELSSLFAKHKLVWKTSPTDEAGEEAENNEFADKKTFFTVVDCLRPLWIKNFPSEEEEEAALNFDRIGICMEIVSILCEHFETCPDRHLHHYYWRDLYSLFALWQGEDSSSIIGGVWIGASMMLSDEEINHHLSSKMILPLLLNPATSPSLQKETWDRHLNTCLLLLKSRGGASSIFGHRMESGSRNRRRKKGAAAAAAEANTASLCSFTVEWFRTEFVPKLYPSMISKEESKAATDTSPSSYYCAPEESFLSTLSKEVGKDSQVK